MDIKRVINFNELHTLHKHCYAHKFDNVEEMDQPIPQKTQPTKTDIRNRYEWAYIS